MDFWFYFALCCSTNRYNWIWYLCCKTRVWWCPRDKSLVGKEWITVEARKKICKIKLSLIDFSLTDKWLEPSHLAWLSLIGSQPFQVAWASWFELQYHQVSCWVVWQFLGRTSIHRHQEQWELSGLLFPSKHLFFFHPTISFSRPSADFVLPCIQSTIASFALDFNEVKNALKSERCARGFKSLSRRH